MDSSCCSRVLWLRKKRVLLVSGRGSVWFTGVDSVIIVEVSVGDDLEVGAAGFWGVLGGVVMGDPGLSCP